MDRDEVKRGGEVGKIFEALQAMVKSSDRVLNSYAKPLEDFKQENGTI